MDVWWWMLAPYFYYTLRTFRFGYRVPLSILAVFVGSVFGFAVERHTSMNDVLVREANRSGMPRPIPMFSIVFIHHHQVRDAVVVVIWLLPINTS
jgi:hypothetical protein